MCGILAQYEYNQKNNINLKQFIYKLQKIQHRGHDSFGISFIEDSEIRTLSKKGLIKDNIKLVSDDKFSKCCLGHVRYKTSGNFESNTHQPIYSSNKFGKFSFVFNGNLSLSQYNKLFNTTYQLDTQLLLYVLVKCSYSYNNWSQLLVYLQNTFDRAFCLIIMTKDKMYLLRDRFGVRPLTFKKNSDNIVISSESIAFNNESENNSENNSENKYNEIYDVKPGEIIEIYNNKIESLFQYKNYNLGVCLFEYVYFLNGVSTWNNINANDFRYNCGIQLAIQEECDQIINNIDEYIVIGIPETGIIGGQGYAKMLNISYTQYITKNNNINRTFILRKEERDNSSKKKYIYDSKLKNKKVIIVDDSIVRGITSKNLVKSLKEVGCKEIHLRVNSPPISNICNYGIDIPNKEQLLINNIPLNKLTQYFDCDSVSYLRIENIKKTIHNDNDLCSGCFDGNYKNLHLEW